jgi:hypothetical protein
MEQWDPREQLDPKEFKAQLVLRAHKVFKELAVLVLKVLQGPREPKEPELELRGL